MVMAVIGDARLNEDVLRHGLAAEAVDVR